MLLIEATKQAIEIIRVLVGKGGLVDCVDSWCNNQEEAELLDGNIDIHLCNVSNTSFRFFENYRFNFLN